MVYSRIAWVPRVEINFVASGRTDASALARGWRAWEGKSRTRDGERDCPRSGSRTREVFSRIVRVPRVDADVVARVRGDADSWRRPVYVEDWRAS